VVSNDDAMSLGQHRRYIANHPRSDNEAES
jgi:hypothetical protein